MAGVTKAKKGLNFVEELVDVVKKKGVKETSEVVKDAIQKKLDDIAKTFATKSFKDLLAEKYIKYENRVGKELALNKVDWENKYKTLYKNREIGKLTEKEFQLLEGGVPKTFKLSNGDIRKVDNLIDGIAKEIKSGQLKSSEFVENQLRKDLEMLQRPDIPINKIEWHLFDGANASMLKKLEKLRDTFGKDKFDFINYNNL